MDQPEKMLRMIVAQVGLVVLGHNILGNFQPTPAKSNALLSWVPPLTGRLVWSVESRPVTCSSRPLIRVSSLNSWDVIWPPSKTWGNARPSLGASVDSFGSECRSEVHFRDSHLAGHSHATPLARS